MERPAGPAVAATLAVAAACGAMLLVAFPERSDYAGHFLAGAGATLLLLALVLPWARPWHVLAAGALAVLAGVGTEATIFRLAEFDLVDLAAQSLGALTACAGVLATRGVRAAAYAAAAGLALTVAGFGFAFA